jgi:hypothetical protein
LEGCGSEHSNASPQMFLIVFVPYSPAKLQGNTSSRRYLAFPVFVISAILSCHIISMDDSIRL